MVLATMNESERSTVYDDMLISKKNLTKQISL